MHMSTPETRSAPTVTFQLPRRSLKIAGAAFGVGVLLFVVVWLNARRHNDFYRVEPGTEDAPAVAMAPLPEPLPAGAGASHMPDAKPLPADEIPQLVETPPPVASTPALVDATPVPSTPALTTTAPPVEAQDRPRPMPGQSPAPEYPVEALRSGESGTVIVQVQVDSNGVPVDARISQRSGSRTLDRAALDAVRRWRFEPAVVEGQPVPGSLEIPFEFKAN